MDAISPFELVEAKDHMNTCAECVLNTGKLTMDSQLCRFTSELYQCGIGSRFVLRHKVSHVLLTNQEIKDMYEQHKQQHITV